MKYANQENTVVYWEDSQGYHSAFMEDERVKAWLSEGNTPEPADPLPNPRIAEIQSALAQLDLKLIRPLSEGETSRVAELVLQKQMLRDELATL